MRVTPVVRRVMLGEAAGFLVGLAIVVFIQTLIPGMLLFQIGLVAWFVTFGAVISLFGLLRPRALSGFSPAVVASRNWHGGLVRPRAGVAGL